MVATVNFQAFGAGGYAAPTELVISRHLFYKDSAPDGANK
jgi:hypothetical protein